MTDPSYADAELAALYDAANRSYDDDLDMYVNFARGGELPSLELGVGSGRVALHLARCGLHVTGIDSSLAMLARAEAALDPLTAALVRLLEADIRVFDFGPERFDLIYCAIGTWQHLLTGDDQLASLRCVAKHLAPGGLYVMQLRAIGAVDWQIGSAPLRLRGVFRLDDGRTFTYIDSYAASASTQTRTGTKIYDIIENDGAVRRRVVQSTVRYASRQELALLLPRAGLRLAHVYGGPDLSPYDDASDTMVVVAQLEGT